MATKKKAAKKKAAAKPAPTVAKAPAVAVNVFAPVHKLVNSPNSPLGAITEILQHISTNPSEQLAEVERTLNSGHSNGEKLQLLRDYLADKV